MALMLAAALLAVRVYRLDLRRALALRLPPWPAWLAVVLGVPSAAILGIGVGEVSGFFFPVPESWLEALNELLVPPDVPFWTQMLPLLSLLPGVCEELAFRGALLHGLHRRLRPLPLVLVVGGIFGLFHVDLFRILPTAFLGTVLAAVTLLTGSILPAIVWHAGNNALVLAAGQSGHLPTEPAAWDYVAATAVLAAAGGILWRWRRPYPGLRSRAERRQPATGPLS
jgi:sodium transport system permease protein